MSRQKPRNQEIRKTLSATDLISLASFIQTHHKLTFFGKEISKVGRILSLAGEFETSQPGLSYLSNLELDGLIGLEA
jgi:hypothetical protein